MFSGRYMPELWKMTIPSGSFSGGFTRGGRGRNDSLIMPRKKAHMSIIELFLVAIGLSMDAFAVAIGKGLSMKRLNWRQAIIIALFFGGFQALMPTLGWLLGAQFDQYVSALEGWIAFALLAFIGGKMIWDAFHEDDSSSATSEQALDVRELLVLAIATSIDAFAAGVALALLDVSIAFSASFIGITTFALSLIGVIIGHQFGSRWEKPSTIVGGVVLVAIGVKILVESFG